MKALDGPVQNWSLGSLVCAFLRAYVAEYVIFCFSCFVFLFFKKCSTFQKLFQISKISHLYIFIKYKHSHLRKLYRNCKKSFVYKNFSKCQTWIFLKNSKQNFEHVFFVFSGFLKNTTKFGILKGKEKKKLFFFSIFCSLLFLFN